MYADIPFWLAIAFMLGGLWLLAWSANLFVGGAESVARSFGISPFLIGMVVIGFGTSAPELAVSAISGGMGHSNLSLGISQSVAWNFLWGQSPRVKTV